MFLRAEHISKSFSGHTALDDITIQIPGNSIFGLLGPNGAGKTTFIRIINQILAPDSGEIFINDIPLKRGHVETIGYLPEERGLYKKMKVGEQAIYLARLKGLSRHDSLKRLKSWFEKFEIQAWWNKKVEELSKGMQQKVQFIVTVIHEPQLLVFDEPFTGFDPLNVQLIRNEILELKKRGATIILSTHNMESVEELCEYISLINNSKTILEGAVAEIRKSHKPDIYEVVFEGNMVSFANALWSGFELLGHKEEDAGNRGGIENSAQRKGVIKAQIRTLNGKTANDLLASILPVVKIHSFSEILPGMRDIFIKTVAENR